MNRADIAELRVQNPAVYLVAGCVAYILSAIALFPDVYFDLLVTYTISRYYFLISVLICIGLLIAGIVRSPRAPLTFIVRLLKKRGLGAAISVVVFILTAAAFSTYKHSLPTILPFFADPFLADLDLFLHSEDPWRLARAIMPAWFELFLFRLYAQAWLVQMVGVLLLAFFLTDDRLRLRYLTAFTVTAIGLGTVGRTIGSSAGPIFYDRMHDPDRFGELIDILATTSSGRRMLELADYLFAAYSADVPVFGSGISAMPTLHVAVAVLNALFITSLSRWWGALAWTYAVLISYGSVYFGWHYALDGYVSIAAVLLVWHYAGRATQTVLSSRGSSPELRPA